jgi:quercetin dioxygenase-like cupin family protein
VNQLTNHTNIMKSKSILLFGMFSALVSACGPAWAQAAAAPRETVTPAFAYPIANVPGKTMSALVVSYAPGAKTPAHRHGRSFVVGYVLEGAIRSRLDNGEERIYRAGESWTEKPGTHHSSSENASATEPAKLIAVFVAKTNAKDLFTLDEGTKPKK